jgi:hypothetical protein
MGERFRVSGVGVESTILAGKGPLLPVAQQHVSRHSLSLMNSGSTVLNPRNRVNGDIIAAHDRARQLPGMSAITIHPSEGLLMVESGYSGKATRPPLLRLRRRRAVPH